MSHKKVMKNVFGNYRIVFLASLIAMAGCQTFEMPSLESLDLIKSPEFAEDAENIETSFPKAVDAPVAPEDVRSSSQWDDDAASLQKLQEASQNRNLGSPEEIDEPNANYEDLKAKAQAYKLDDPAVERDVDYPPSNLKRRRN